MSKRSKWKLYSVSSDLIISNFTQLLNTDLAHCLLFFHLLLYHYSNHTQPNRPSAFPLYKPLTTEQTICYTILFHYSNHTQPNISFAVPFLLLLLYTIAAYNVWRELDGFCKGFIGFIVGLHVILKTGQNIQAHTNNGPHFAHQFPVNVPQCICTSINKPNMHCFLPDCNSSCSNQL